MKQILYFLVALFIFNTSSTKTIAQIENPVKWNFNSEKVGNNEYLLKFSAEIAKTWHVYAQDIPEGGPIPTTFNFDKSDNYKLIDKTIEKGHLEEAYDPSFDMQLKWYSNKVTFVQKVNITETSTIKGFLTFMTCNDEMCLPPEDIDFEFNLTNQGGIKKDKTNEDVQTKINIDTNSTTVEANPSGTDLKQFCGPETANMWVSNDETKDNETQKSWFTIFLLGFLGGLAALLTPCVFPMIPLTVSYFTKQSSSKAKGISNGLLYGASIVLIYVFLAFGITVIFGADALNALSTNMWFNLIFFVLFLIFAISFFGAFEITLPSSWISKSDKAADKGGLIGIFFMAFTLSLVSFSCTGPIIGSLLVQAAIKGGISGPILGMTGFSFALALPFGLFAAFPGWLNALPKSGGWLNSVKVVLGFLELALALKFLSNADLVVQAHLIHRELFIALWIIIFGLMSLYLLGFIKFSHDSELKFISVPRLFFAILALAFSMYLIPGLWGSPLKLLSGFPPPSCYSEWQQNCDLEPIQDYETGMALAKKENKPVMVDFTGWACVNCRKMEEHVWTDPKIHELLQEEYIVISLYVDEKTPLSEAEQIEVNISGNTKKLRTIGNKWSAMQICRSARNSQPWYVLIDHDEHLLNSPRGYTPVVNDFKKFLEQGLKQFQSNQ